MTKTFGYAFSRLILSCCVVFSVTSAIDIDLFTRSDISRILLHHPIADTILAQMRVTRDTTEFSFKKTPRAFNADASQTCGMQSLARPMRPNRVDLRLPGLTKTCPVSGIHSPNLHNRPPPHRWDSDPEHHG